MRELIAFSLAAALVASTGPALAKVAILVDLSDQRMTVKKNGGESIVWKISSGRDGFETPAGSFSVQRMDADHHSDEYDQAPMPWSIFFYRGLAIHGTYERGLGSPRSHGCIRLSIPHARELYSWVEQYGASIEITGYASGISGGGALVEEIRPARRQSKRAKRQDFDPGVEVMIDGSYYPY